MPPLYTAFHFLIRLAGKEILLYFLPPSLTCKKKRTIIYLARQPEQYHLVSLLSFIFQPK